MRLNRQLNKRLLTGSALLVYPECVKTSKGCHVSPAGCGEEAVNLSGDYARRVSVHREVHGGFFEGLNNTRRFLFAPIVRISKEVLYGI